jgi:uncharacterized membrane protein
VDNIFPMFLTQLATRMPTLLVYAIGLLLAISFWSRHPKPSMLVFLAMLIALFAVIASTFLFVYLPRAGDDLGLDHQKLGLYFSIVGLTANMLHAVAMVFLLVAVFVGRSQLLQRPGWNADDDRTVEQHPGPDIRIQDY